MRGLQGEELVLGQIRKLLARHFGFHLFRRFIASILGLGIGINAILWLLTTHINCHNGLIAWQLIVI